LELFNWVTWCLAPFENEELPKVGDLSVITKGTRLAVSMY